MVHRITYIGYIRDKWLKCLYRLYPKHTMTIKTITTTTNCYQNDSCLYIYEPIEYSPDSHSFFNNSVLERTSEQKKKTNVKI